ncbi:hypothetical protein [Algivirga pacifica]|uniref:Uncharacterized protein n=1 Tax=Algivirga pacifica TaxID=1162670 RepID=A0ABP9DDR3_9BACT
MSSPIVEINMDTLVETGDTFSLTNVVGFSITNSGPSDAFLGYVGSGKPIALKAGESREFHPVGYQFKGQMEVAFDKVEVGLIEVIKYVR